MKLAIRKEYGSVFYDVHFDNLTDLHDYLLSNPKVNNQVFDEQASIIGTWGFAGENLDKAIHYCIGGYENGLDKFRLLVNNVKNAGYDDLDSKKLVRSIYGGVGQASLIAAEIPACMLSYRRDTEAREINIYFQLGYPAGTTENQIFNRGVATIHLIQALEEKGYIVNLNAFELSSHSNEFVMISINLKNPTELLNISKCYYPFVAREFLRRCLFRVLESVPVETLWNYGYGEPLDVQNTRNMLNLNKNDLVIGYPKIMSICGINIYDDTISLIENLNLQNEFDVEKIKRKIR